MNSDQIVTSTGIALSVLFGFGNRWLAVAVFVLAWNYIGIAQSLLAIAVLCEITRQTYARLRSAGSLPPLQ